MKADMEIVGRFQNRITRTEELIWWLLIKAGKNEDAVSQYEAAAQEDVTLKDEVISQD